MYLYTQCHIIIHSVTSSYTVSRHHTQCHIIIHSVTSSYTVSHHHTHCLQASLNLQAMCVSHHHTQCHIIIHSVTSSYTVSHHHTHCVQASLKARGGSSGPYNQCPTIPPHDSRRRRFEQGRGRNRKIIFSRKCLRIWLWQGAFFFLLKNKIETKIYAASALVSGFGKVCLFFLFFLFLF